MHNGRPFKEEAGEEWGGEAERAVVEIEIA